MKPARQSETKSPAKIKDFKEIYERSCALKGIYPVKTITAFLQDDILDVNADKLDKRDWLPLIESLKCRHKLKFLAIRSMRGLLKSRHETRLGKRNSTSHFNGNVLRDQVTLAIATSLRLTSHLTCLELQNLPLTETNIDALTEGLANNKTLQHLSLNQCPIRDSGLEVLSKVLKCCLNITSVNLSQCSLTWKAVDILANVIKNQAVERHSDAWKETLRNSVVNMDNVGGLRRLTLNENPLIEDKGAEILSATLAEDLWLKAIDVQNCGIQDQGAAALLKALKRNTTLFILDVRRNAIRDRDVLLRVSQQLSFNTQGQTTQFKWFKIPSDTNHVGQKQKRGIPWRVAARLSTVRYRSARHLPGIANVSLLSRPSLVGFSADDRTDSCSSRSSAVGKKRRTQNARQSSEIIKAIQAEISQVRELLKKEKAARFEAEKRIAKLSSENEKLRQDLTHVDEITLTMVEATFNKFNKFLQTLHKVGYRTNPDEYETTLNDSKKNESHANVIERHVTSRLDACLQEITESCHSNLLSFRKPSKDFITSRHSSKESPPTKNKTISPSERRQSQNTSQSLRSNSRSTRDSDSSASFPNLSTSSPESLASIITQSDKF